jgi:WD40 repeat protein
MATTLAVWGWLERNRAGIMHKTAEEARQQAVFEGEKAKLFSEQAEARKLQELRARARLLGESARKEIGQGNTTNAILLALEILSEQDENIDHNALAPVRLALYSALLEHREWRLLKPKTVVPYATFYPASHPARLQLLTFGKNTIQHWEVTDQHETATLALPGHRGQVRSAAFRSDGQRLVTAAEDKTARLWERDGKLLKELPHPAAVTRAAFHPDGQGLLTAAAKTVYLWDEHGALQKELPHLEAVIAATFRADGQGLLTATAKTIYWWDASGALLQQRDFPAPVQYAAMSVNGQQVVAVTDDSWVRIWDTVSNQEIFLGGGERPAHFRPVRQAAFSPDGRYVVTASDDGTSRLWLANDGRFFASLAGHDRAVLHAEFSPDSTRVVTTSEDGTVRLWTVHGQAPTTVLSGHSEAVRQVEFSTDGTRLLTASEDNTARLWEVPQGQELQRFAGHQQGVELVRLSPDGRRLVTVDAMRTTRLWDSQSGMLIAVLVEPAPAELVGQDTGDVDVAFSPDSRLVATASNDTTVHLWNAANGKRLPGFAGHIDKVHAVSFSPADGRYLVTASDDNSARLWDVARRQALVVLPHEKPVQYAVFSPSGEQLITVAPGMPVAVWHMPELQAERHAEPLSLPCPGHQKEVSHAAVNRAGSHLITTADDGTVCLFENEQGTFHLRRSFFHRMLGGRGFWWWRSPRGRSTRREIPGIKHATFSPDGQRLLTASKDGTIRLWDTATGRPLVLLSGHDAAFHPDGQQIAIAALNHQVLLWTPFASTAELLRYACNVVPRQLTEEQREEFGLSRHNDVDDDTGLQDAATAPSGYDCATLGSRRD